MGQNRGYGDAGLLTTRTSAQMMLHMRRDVGWREHPMGRVINR
jgi:hypothetical protein